MSARNRDEQGGSHRADTTVINMTQLFAMRCHENGIEYRFITIKDPWTNDQVKRLNLHHQMPEPNT